MEDCDTINVPSFQALIEIVDKLQAARTTHSKYSFLAGLKIRHEVIAQVVRAAAPLLTRQPWMLWTEDKRVRSVVEVTAEDISALQVGSVLAYCCDTVYHTGILSEIVDAERKIVRMWHNHPDNLTRSAAETQIDLSQSTVFVVNLQPGAIAEGFEDRRKPSRYFTKFGDYHPLHNNCEHYVTYALFGERLSFFSERLLRLGFASLLLSKE